MFTPKRLFILGIVVALVASYVGPIRGVLSQRGELARQQTALAKLLDERDRVQAQIKSLDDSAVIEARARQLGYTKQGETPYRVSGLERPKPPVARRDEGSFWDWLPDFR